MFEILVRHNLSLKIWIALIFRWLIIIFSIFFSCPKWQVKSPCSGMPKPHRKPTSRDSRDDPKQLKHTWPASPPSKYCSNKMVQSMAVSARTPWRPGPCFFHIKMEVGWLENDGKIIYKWGMISKLPCLMKLMASLLVEKNATVLDEFFWAPKIAICRTRISGFSQPIVIVRTDTSRIQIWKKKVLFSMGTLA